MTRVRVLSGSQPGPQLGHLLVNRESCLVRFREDPGKKIWVCSRLGDRIFGVPLNHDEQWVAG